jgi:O-antigen/teichoic acid export membrane protein
MKLLMQPRQRIMRQDALTRRLASGGWWSVLGAGSSRAFAIAGAAACGRLLGRAGFGELVMIQSTVAMLATVAGLGGGLTLTRYLAQLRATEPEKAGRIWALVSRAALGTAALAALILLVAAPWAARALGGAADMAAPLRVAAALVLLSVVGEMQTAALCGFEAFRAVAAVGFWSGVASAAGMVAGAWFWGAAGAVAGLATGAGVAWALNSLALRKASTAAGVHYGAAGCWGERRILWTFQLPALLSAVTSGPVTWLCGAILANTAGGYAQLALFGAANQWRMAIEFVPTTLAGMSLTFLSHTRGQGNARAYYRVLWSTLAVVAVFSVGGTAPVCLFSRLVMASYGAGFAQGQPVLMALALAAIPSATTAVIGRAIASSGKMWTGFGLNLIWAGCFIGGTLLLLGHGALGLALALAAAYLVHLVTVSIYVGLGPGRAKGWR